MRTFLAIILGFFSGFLIYMASALLFTDGDPSESFVMITFFGGWVFSTWLIVRGAKTLSKVFSRAFLLGAAEWLAIIPVGVVFSGKVLNETAQYSNGSGAEMAGAAIGAGMVSFMTGGLAIFMVFICLLGFAISYFIGREMKPEVSTSTKTCHECAEQIQAAAKKCRYCGAEVQ